MKMVFENHLESQPFLQQYLANEQKVMEFYDYPAKKEGLSDRLIELGNRNYDREKLIHILTDFNKKYTVCDKTYHQINKLQDGRSVVVVGGQQAGLMTGPIYTINKIIAILHEAKRLEDTLHIPVVPIFWIAGEDHDIDEVNHLHVHNNVSVKKFFLQERNDLKIPATNRSIKKDVGEQLIKEVFQFLKETTNTIQLYEDLLADLREDTNYVDWFASLIHRLFKGTGLVLMDAGDASLRELEKPFFKKFIEKNDSLRNAFVEGAVSFRESGFGEPIDIDKANAHLFIYDQGQRQLLEKVDGQFRDKNGNQTWSEQDLLLTLELDSAAFSNNVVTRPIMQDFVLPVISFIAGPGELKYWGVLKQAFHLFDIRMPIVCPRLHITFISRRIEKNLHWLQKTPKIVMGEGLDHEKELWLKDNIPDNISGIFEDARDSLVVSLANVSSSFPSMGRNGKQIHAKFEDHFLNLMLNYEKRIHKFYEKSNQAIISRFDEVEAELRPNGHLQERYLNIVPFLNVYGADLVQRVVDQVMAVENPLYGEHLYIYL